MYLSKQFLFIAQIISRYTRNQQVDSYEQNYEKFWLIANDFILIPSFVASMQSTRMEVLNEFSISTLNRIAHMSKTLQESYNLQQKGIQQQKSGCLILLKFVQKVINNNLFLQHLVNSQLINSISNYKNKKMLYSEEVGFLQNINKVVTIPQNTIFPHDCIGLLRFNNQDGLQIIGTAFLISPNFALTVAHNIFNRKHTHYFVNHTFYPGISGFYWDYELPQGIQVKSYRFLQDFKQGTDQHSKKCDYALLKLKKSVCRQQYCKLGLNYNSKDQQIGLFGYNKNTVQDNCAKQQGLWSAGQHKMQSKLFLTHKLSTQKGNSGSPIMIRRGNQYIIFAIHQGGNSLSNFNVARLITDDLVENILKWEKEMFTSQIQLNKMQDVGATIISNKNSSLQKKLKNTKIIFKPTQDAQTDLFWDLSTPYASMFSVEGKSAQLMNNCFCQITSCVLATSGTIHISFRVTRYGRTNSGIDLGIITQSRKNMKDNTASTQSVKYATNNYNQKGSIKMDGKTVKLEEKQLFMPPNTPLILSINTDKLLLSFKNTYSQKVYTFPLSPLFRNKKLYLFAQMWNQADRVTLNRIDSP